MTDDITEILIGDGWLVVVMNKRWIGLPLRKFQLQKNNNCRVEISLGSQDYRRVKDINAEIARLNAKKKGGDA